MWSKIRPVTLPIAVKLTILYTVILSCILLFTSFLTVTGMYYVLYSQANDDINLSMTSVINHLAAGNLVDQSLLKANLLVPGIVLRIFDAQNNILIDSSPDLPAKQAFPEENYLDIPNLHFPSWSNENLRIVRINTVYFFYANQAIWQNGRLFQLHLLKPMFEQNHFLKTLVKSLIVTNLFGLFIAIVSGMFLSRKILRPIRDITHTAKEIEINDLGKRINVTNSNDELQELANTFNHMLNRIQCEFEQQRRFVSDASHELRTPITVISGYADMLDRWGKQDPLVLDEGIEAIKSEANNMYSLIAKLLFLAKTDQGKQVITKKALEIEHLIVETAQETRLIAPHHQISLAKNEPATIFADISSIKEMLRIFIENSIKYTPHGGNITISSIKTPEHLEISIQDTGIGIPKEEQHKIFDRFYRVDRSRSKMTGGSGLGLSIARWIAEQHDSTIHLTSIPEEGTSITVKIPLYLPQTLESNEH